MTENIRTCGSRGIKGLKTSGPVALEESRD